MEIVDVSMARDLGVYIEPAMLLSYNVRELTVETILPEKDKIPTTSCAHALAGVCDIRPLKWPLRGA